MANCPKRSRRLASRNSMPYLVTSNFEHSPPKRVGYLEASHRVMGPMPDLPAQRSSQTCSTLSPREVIQPRPVMTVRRFMVNEWAVKSGQWAVKTTVLLPTAHCKPPTYLFECSLM